MILSAGRKIPVPVCLLRHNRTSIFFPQETPSVKVKDVPRRDCGAGRSGFGHFLLTAKRHWLRNPVQIKERGRLLSLALALGTEFPLLRCSIHVFMTSLFSVCCGIFPINLQRWMAERSSLNMSHLLCSLPAGFIPLLIHPSIF